LFEKQTSIVLFQQNHDSSDINERKKRRIQLIVSSEYSAKPFDLLEEALHQMALFVCMPVN
jgi:hypothetical protein